MTQPDGEKELVLGNKQLISLFFVVVALCGVFFAMGYMIGRNSTKGVVVSGSGDTNGAPPQTAAPPRQQSEPPREAAAEPVAQASAPAADQPVETKPAQDTSPAERKPEARPEAKPEAKPEPKEEKPMPTESGATYLQVTALPRGDAENVVRTLREQNFPAILSESSKDGLFRVLVGPYHQTSQLAESKARLKTLGFANAFVQKQ